MKDLAKIICKKLQLDDSQIEAVRSSIFNNTLISASAGTGKTRTLAAIYTVLIISEKLKPGEIVAITFTNKAADELRNRIREYLFKFAEYKDFEPELRSYIRTSIFDLTFANISTIDSFIFSHLRSSLLETGINLDTKIQNEDSINTIFTEYVDQFILKKISNKDSDLINILKVLSLKELKSFLNEMIFEILPLTSIDDIEEITTKNDKLLNILKKFLNDERIKLLFSKETYNYIKGRTEKADQIILSFNNVKAILDKIQHNYFPDKNDISHIKMPSRISILSKNSKKDSSYLPNRINYTDIRKIINDIISEYQGLYLDINNTSIYKSIINITAQLNSEWHETKTRKNILTFSDLGKIFYNTLLNNKNFRTIIKKKYKKLLVDEYQDTNEIQWKIFKLICEDLNSAAVSVKDINLHASKIIVVGDAKQSIYAFRKADVSIFNKTAKLLNNTKTLNINYRSHNTVLDFFNNSFPDIFKKNYKYTDILLKDELKIHSIEKLDCGSFYNNKNKSNGIHIVNVPEDITKQEAVLKLLRKLNSVGIDNKNISLVFRTLSSKLPGYIDIFNRRKIKYLIFKGEQSQQFSFFNDIYIYLSALSNPNNNYSTISLLRSPFVRLSDKTIFELHKRKEPTMYKKWQGSNIKAVEFKTFEKLRKLVNIVHVETLIKKIFTETKIYKYIANSTGGFNNITAFINFFFDCRQLRNSLGLQLNEFLQNFDRIITKPFIKSGKDSIILTTVHSSKGLEFDYVIIPEIENSVLKTISTNRPNILYHKDFGIAIKYVQKGINASRYSIVRKILDTEDFEEQKRLIYVALTRAKKGLYILKYNKYEPNSWSNFILSERNGPWLLKNAVYSDINDFHVKLTPDIDKKELENKNKMITEFNNMTKIINDLNRKTSNSLNPVELNVTFLSGMIETRNAGIVEGRDIVNIASNLSTIFIPGKKRNFQIKKTGTILHKILENSQDLKCALSFLSKYNKKELPKIITLKKMLKNFYRSTLYTDMINSELVKKEFKIRKIFDGIKITGVIDLLYKNSNGIFIIDYKSRLKGNSIKKYAIQLNIYRIILQHEFNENIIMKLFDLEKGTATNIEYDPDIEKKIRTAISNYKELIFKSPFSLGSNLET